MRYIYCVFLNYDLIVDGYVKIRKTSKQSVREVILLDKLLCFIGTYSPEKSRNGNGARAKLR